MKPERPALPEVCPYLNDWRWDYIRRERGMSVEDVLRVWQARRQLAQEAGYAPSRRKMGLWVRAGIDNPFQSEDAFQVRLNMALRGAR